MANKILLPAQKMSVEEIVKSIGGKKIKKIFFQSNLKSISGDDATFGVVAYAAHKNSSHKWELGSKVSATEDNSKPVKVFSVPITIGNCEWVNTNVSKKRKKESLKAFSVRKAQANAITLLNTIAEDKKLLKKAKLLFKAKKYPNPHIEYSIELDPGVGQSTIAVANPSPPATPAE